MTSVCADLTGIGKLLCQFHEILNSVLPVLVALGVVYFVWGIFLYVLFDDEEAKKRGLKRMIWGIIGLAVIVGLWGLVSLLVNTFDLGGVSAPDITNLVTTPGAGLGGFCFFGPRIQGLLDYATCIIGKSVIPLIFAVAVAMFLWGVVQFVINDSDEGKKEKGKQFLIWGLIGLTVMVGIWGLVAILGDTFGLNVYFIPQVR